MPSCVLFHASRQGLGLLRIFTPIIHPLHKRWNAFCNRCSKGLLTRTILHQINTETAAELLSIQIVTTAPEFQTGQASMTVSTAAVPSSGTVTVDLITQTSASGMYDGVAGVDAFKVTANDWVGIQGRQLQYEFRYMRVSS